jgi:hypothetical protein
MRYSTRSRLVAFIALAVLGLGVTFAVADSLTLVAPRTVEPHGEVSPPLDAATGETAGPAHDELGAHATAPERRAAGAKKSEETKGCKTDKRCEGGRRGGAGDEGDPTEIVAALIPAGSGGSGGGDLALPCSDTNSCVDRVGHLITEVVDRVPDLPKIRECTSSIGGQATCFHFGGGNYLVGDSPADGQAELGFCTSSGYYYVSGPSLEGGAGAACPGDRAGGDGGDAPTVTVHECTSSSGGDATCFYFGGGNYLVSDPLADGGGELGFCTSDDYYYVSAPSAEGDAGVECPDARAAD